MTTADLSASPAAVSSAGLAAQVPRLASAVASVTVKTKSVAHLSLMQLDAKAVAAVSASTPTQSVQAALHAQLATAAAPSLATLHPAAA